MRPSRWIVPVTFPFGHHISATRAPVSWTVPRQMLLSGLISTLVRLIVRVSSPLTQSLIWKGKGVLEHLWSRPQH